MLDRYGLHHKGRALALTYDSTACMGPQLRTGENDAEPGIGVLVTESMARQAAFLVGSGCRAPRICRVVYDKCVRMSRMVRDAK